MVAWHPVTEIKMADHIWGWREFFDMVSSLLAAASWQYGTANQRYSEYVVEGTTAFCKQLNTCLAYACTLVE